MIIHWEVLKATQAVWFLTRLWLQVRCLWSHPMLLLILISPQFLLKMWKSRFKFPQILFCIFATNSVAEIYSKFPRETLVKCPETFNSKSMRRYEEYRNEEEEVDDDGDDDKEERFSIFLLKKFIWIPALGCSIFLGILAAIFGLCIRLGKTRPHVKFQIHRPINLSGPSIGSFTL